jgi:demethoxyubiquinone hydroxylase (CLK1/Coq7/Cat5 family)
MACTVAIEETIDEHYAGQAAALGDDEAELRATVEKFRADELATATRRSRPAPRRRRPTGH